MNIFIFKINNKYNKTEKYINTRDANKTNTDKKKTNFLLKPNLFCLLYEKKNDLDNILVASIAFNGRDVKNLGLVFLDRNDSFIKVINYFVIKI